MAAGTAKPTPSERELEVMSVLWELGSGTVADVRKLLNDTFEPDVAYTTVLTMLRSLRAKGWARVEEEGRAHRYFAVIGRDSARRRSLRRLTDLLYSGSRDLLLKELVSDRRLRTTDLQRLRVLLDERLKGREP
jgi:BlaI family transcriptional regulator, penicillinase repressor